MDMQDHTVHTADDLCEKYAGRGLSQSAAEDAKRQEQAEADTTHRAPEAYRYSALNDREKNRYRTSFDDGERRMTSGDLIRYSRETHGDPRKRAEAEDKPTRWKGNGIISGEPQKQRLFPFSRGSSTDTKDVAPSRAETFLAAWFPKDRSNYVHDTKRRRFPSTYMAALFVVIISMALLVGSALLLNREEREVLSLREQVASLEKTESSLEDELAVKNDLYTIRETAIREYGMVDGRYVNMQFLTMTGEEQIVAYNEREEKKVGLAALLSGFLGGKN